MDEVRLQAMISFFLRDLTYHTEFAKRAENKEYLGDMLRTQTIVDEDSVRHPYRILDFFGVKSEGLTRDRAWSMVDTIRQQVFLRLLAETGQEYRLDWSRDDRAFCFFYRARDIDRDRTRDLGFVRKNTVPVIASAELRDSQVHGFGLFATRPVPKGMVMATLDGQRMAGEVYDGIRHRMRSVAESFWNYFLSDWNALPGGDVLVRAARTNYSYINHASRPNLHVRYRDGRIEVVAGEGIEADTELFRNYRDEPLPASYLTAVGSGFLVDPDVRF